MSSESHAPTRSVGLVGKDSDIKRLAEHFSNMQMGWIRQEDARSGWVISATELEKTTKPEEAVSLARTLIGDHNNLMYISHPDYRGVSVGDYTYVDQEDGSRMFNIMIQETVGIAVTIQWDGEPPGLHQEPFDIDQMARAAKEHPDIAMVLSWLPKLVGDWMKLYDFAEAIGRVLPGRLKRLDSLRECARRGWITEQERKRFEKSANAERHPAAERRRIPMTLKEGQSLMRRVAGKLVSHLAEASHSRPVRSQASGRPARPLQK